MPRNGLEVALAYGKVFDTLYDVVPPEHGEGLDFPSQVQCYDFLNELQAQGFTGSEAMNMVLGTILDIRDTKRQLHRVVDTEDVIYG